MKGQKHWMSGAVRAIRFVANAIKKKSKKINALNLFPVPDGDTGTNLSLMLTNMAADIAKVPSNATPKEMLRAIARSANERARGNSGTILAAIITGMVTHLLDAEELTPELLVGALERANRNARKSVMKPAEGTMLTVIKDISETAREAYDQDNNITLRDLRKPILKAAMRSTDDSERIMRDILNNDTAGIDAGAYGLSIIVHEILDFFTDDISQLASEILDETPESDIEDSFDAPFPENGFWVPDTPLYCTEFVLVYDPNIHDLDPGVQLNILGNYGDSGVFIAFDGLAKAHVHTDTPWEVFQHFAQYGELSFAKAENMRIQTEERLAEIRANKKPFGIVAVASGEGAKDILLNMGVAAIVDGGQTNNPEVGQIRDAIINANARVVMVLPGNKNVVATAKKACELAKEKDGTIGITVPTDNFQESIAALVAIPETITPDHDFEALAQDMASAAKEIRTASITTAVKNYSTKTVSAMTGQFISIINDTVAFSHENLLEIIKITIQEIKTDETSIITVYVGADFPIPLKKLEKAITKNSEGIEYEIFNTGQPVYHALISVE